MKRVTACELWVVGWVVCGIVGPASARVVAVDMSSPYACGEVIIDVGHKGRYDPVLDSTVPFPDFSDRDTLVLGERTRLSCVWSYSFMLDDRTVEGALIVLPEDSSTALGYRWQETLSTVPFSTPSTRTLGSTDTVWQVAGSDPDSLQPLDRVRTVHKEYTDTRGLWAYEMYRPLEGHKTILYATLHSGRHIKLQVAEVILNQFPSEGEIVVTHLRILWAADSAGNGVFKHEDAAIRPPRSAPETAGSAANRPHVQVPSSRPYFDLKGRPMARSSSGVYITPKGRALMIQRRDALW